MSDIFISYARPNEPLARKAAEALRAAGYAVWRDDELPAHRAYSDVIEERIKSAKAVLVLWSNEAVKSQWVRAEADAARELGTLVQVSLDGILPPMPFNQIQCADLFGWTGDTASPGWAKVESSIASLVGSFPGQPLIWDIPDDNQPASAWAETHGFTHQRTLTRMYRGLKETPGDPRRQFALAGPEVG